MVIELRQLCDAGAEDMRGTCESSVLGSIARTDVPLSRMRIVPRAGRS